MSCRFHSPTHPAWGFAAPVDHIGWGALLRDVLRRFLLRACRPEVEGARGRQVVAGAWKTSSTGTFSPSVRVILDIFFLLASASRFSMNETSKVGVIGLKRSEVGVGVGGKVATLGSLGDRGTGLRWMSNGGGRLGWLERLGGNFSVEGRSREDDEEDEEYGSARDVTEDAADDTWEWVKVTDACLHEDLTDLIEAAEELELVEGAGEWVRGPMGSVVIGASMSWGVVPMRFPIFLAERWMRAL